LDAIEKYNVFIKNPWSQWTKSERKRAKFDCIAKNIITFALNSNEFFRVSKCAYAKNMWGILESTHEGSNEIDLQENDISSSRSNGDEQKNLCLMAKGDSDTSSVSSST